MQLSFHLECSHPVSFSCIPFVFGVCVCVCVYLSVCVFLLLCFTACVSSFVQKHAKLNFHASDTVLLFRVLNFHASHTPVQGP